jgi:uncharacterized membrane protein YfcA
VAALITLPLGLLVGLALGALGGGGSILAVPALVYVVGQTPQAATSTSLVVVALASLGGLVGHWRSGNVAFVPGLAFGLAGVGGSIAGSHLNAALPADALLGVFAVLMLVASAAMLRRATRSPDDPPRDDGDVGGRGSVAVRTARRVTPGLAARVLGAGTVVGFLTGLLGVGGGFVIVPALVLVLGFAMPVAVGTSLLVIAINATMALAAHATGPGQVEWDVALPFTAAALVGVLLGTAITDRVPAGQLTRAFAVLLVAVALYVGADALGVIA